MSKGKGSTISGEPTFRVTPLNSDKAEPLTTTRRQMNEELKKMTPGQSVIGAVGDIRVEEEEEPERLNTEEKSYKKRLFEFLTKYIEPSELSESKPNPIRDRRSFVRKMERQTLGELRRFWSGKIPEEPTEDQIAELQARYKDLSP